MPQLEAPAWRAAAILILCVPLGACHRASQQLDEKAMARELRALASLSAEGAFVAGELRAGHLTPSFASVHIDDLAKDASRARREIAQPAPPDLERRHAAAEALAGQLSRALRETAIAQGGPDAQLERRQQELLHLKAEFDALARSAEAPR